jgi:hypothetical protein
VTAVAQTPPASPELELVRVRAWFGQHPIGDWHGDPATGERIAAGWRRRFGTNNVTTTPLQPSNPQG